MSSSTLNSDGAKRARPRAGQHLVYGLGLIAVFVVLLLVLQLAVVRFMPDSADHSARFIVKLLTDPRRNIVLGDSHVGQLDRMGKEYAFLGRPGITSFEMRRFAETFYRDKAPGRVVIAAGPQLFAEVRQAEWRSLNGENLKYQILPFPLFVLEPEITKAVGAVLKELWKDLLRVGKALAAETSAHANGDGSNDEAAIKAARAQFRALDHESSRLVSFYDLSAETRALLLQGRFERQMPSLDFKETIAWRHFLVLLEFLVAQGAEVCIIRTPIVAEYRQMIANDAEGARFTEALEAVRVEANARGMRFRDFTEIVPGLPGFYFKNQDHLNALGHRVFWPRVEEACFGNPAAQEVSGDTLPLYHKLDLENAGFETTLEHAPACVPGWSWRGPLPLRQARSRRSHPKDSPFRSAASFGAFKVEADGKNLWWSLGKTFAVGGFGKVDVQVRVRSRGLTLPTEAGDDDNDMTLYIGKDDAFIEVEVLDAKGKPIKLSREVRYSTTLSEQVAAGGLTEAEARADWQTLSHSFELPKRARVLRIWITATDGGGKRLPRGWKGGRPTLLLDDFELMTRVRIEETAVPKNAKEKAPC